MLYLNQALTAKLDGIAPTEAGSCGTRMENSLFEEADPAGFTCPIRTMTQNGG